MSAGPLRPARVLLLAPARCAVVLVACCVASTSVLLVAWSVLAAVAIRAGQGAGRVVVESNLSSTTQGGTGLRREDLGLLRAALPDHDVGGARWLEPAEFAPPLAEGGELVVVAADPSWVRIVGLGVTSGRPLDLGDELHASPVALVSPRVGRQLGDGRTEGLHVRLDRGWFTVVGQLAPPADGIPAVDFLLPLTAGLERLAGDQAPELGELRVASASGHDVPGVLIERVLERAHGGTGAWSVGGTEKGGELRGDTRAMLTGVFAVLALVALGLASFGLSSALRRGRRALSTPPPRALDGALLGVLLALGATPPALALARWLAAGVGDVVGLEPSLTPLVAVVALGLVPSLAALVGALRARDRAW